MINEIVIGGKVIGGPPAYVVFECDYCQDKKYNSLANVERHCWNEGQDHRNANLSRIKAEALHDTANANTELQNDIDNVIKGKKDAQLKQQLAKQHREESRLKTTLPYATQ